MCKWNNYFLPNKLFSSEWFQDQEPDYPQGQKEALRLCLNNRQGCFSFFLLYFGHTMACMILIPRPRTKPMPSAMEVQRLHYGTTRKSCFCSFKCPNSYMTSRKGWWAADMTIPNMGPHWLPAQRDSPHWSCLPTSSACCSLFMGWQ